MRKILKRAVGINTPHITKLFGDRERNAGLNLNNAELPGNTLNAVGGMVQCLLSLALWYWQAQENKKKVLRPALLDKSMLSRSK